MHHAVRHLLRKRSRSAGTLSTLLIALLSACGGGGGGSTDAGSGGATALAVSGTAATGAAVAGKTVDLKCASGTGSATTANDGSYSVSIAGGKLPCLARVTVASGNVLHSLSAAAGSSATLNITPVTQLIVARFAAADPASYYAGFDAAAAAALTAAAVANAQTAVVAVLKAGGVDLASLGDLIGAQLKPKAGSAAGDAYDQALDALAAALASAGTSLATLTGTVVNNAASTVPAAAAATVSLPPELLLKPAAANCSALRSGRYLAISPTAGSVLSDQIGSFTVNATTLVVTWSDGSTSTWAASGACHYTDDAGKTDIMVSQAGVIVARYTNDAGRTFQPAVAVPEQTHTLDELAGAWNAIGMERNAANTGYTGIAANATIDATGKMTAANWCQNDTNWSISGSDCAAPTGALPSLRVNSAGGFDVVDANGSSNGRAVVYRAGNGDLMMLKVDGDGSFQLRTRQRTNALPAVGSGSATWNIYANAQLFVPSALDPTSNVVASVDSAAGSYVRTQQTVGGTNAHPETVFINTPRDGYNRRAAGTSVAPATGATITFNEWTNVNLRGMGMGGLIIPTTKLFDLYVVQP